jgi:hypothetical protein
MSDDERELTVDELDVEGENQRLMFYMGAAYMALTAGNGQRVLTSDALWKLIPYIKALAVLAEENPGRTRQLWAQTLGEPMPFGGAPVGMPKVKR